MTNATPSPRQAASRQDVICVLFSGVMSLDVIGPMQVFATANDVRRQHGLPPAYRLILAAEQAGPVPTSAGMTLMADTPWAAVPLGRRCTVLVPGGAGVEQAMHDVALRHWLQRAEPRVARMGSVCSGALILAQADLLRGMTATTHWNRAEQLRQDYPDIHVEADRLHTYDPGHPRQSHLFTSAGVTAGIDLALALVEADQGRPLALAVARHLVMFMRRPGGQAQFSTLLSPETTQAPRLAKLLEWIPGQLGEDLSVERLATQASMPPRTLARVFRQELDTTPARYVERVRIEAASALLGQRQASVSTVARLCGFGHPESLRRSFHKHLAISPQAFAERFGR
ncbi:MAG TPA: helix-turn-helix domain-containing protein [Bordetella sp.]|uniref:GlxA family transcriptional regulator n=1 Tax=Bordetella sp. TaxID=28081 RepID=UPI002ED58D5F